MSILKDTSFIHFECQVVKHLLYLHRRILDAPQKRERQDIVGTQTCHGFTRLRRVFLPKGSGGLPKDSKVKTDQIRTLDKALLAKLLGRVDQKQIAEIDKAIKIHLEIE